MRQYKPLTSSFSLLEIVLSFPILPVAVVEDEERMESGPRDYETLEGESRTEHGVGEWIRTGTFRPARSGPLWARKNPVAVPQCHTFHLPLPLPTLHMGKPTQQNPGSSSDGKSFAAPSTVSVMTSLSLTNRPPTSTFGAFVWRCRMWFECTFVFTMLEPWEKILCGEYTRGRGTLAGSEQFGFRSRGVRDSVPARWHGFRPVLPPTRQDNVRQGNVLLVRRCLRPGGQLGNRLLVWGLVHAASSGELSPVLDSRSFPDVLSTKQCA